LGGLQRPCNGNSLLLSARKLARDVVHWLSKPTCFKAIKALSLLSSDEILGLYNNGNSTFSKAEVLAKRL
jgi:hypothetical protein